MGFVTGFCLKFKADCYSDLFFCTDKKWEQLWAVLFCVMVSFV
ncbi:hypothetical protein CUS_7945 [Ruminococcus albus 8]|uniref:Uncharacterized protein n=1 Tax=Ruminococcus albus 8 TaxID=246199 RepID=E9SAI3_RUMAL|nr:hypothetical protein CUS_7945 [Ruminococcus albus 8]